MVGTLRVYWRKIMIKCLALHILELLPFGKSLWQKCLGVVAVSLLFGILTSSHTIAYALGGDLLAPYPSKDARPGKQEAKAMVVDSSGNTIVAGYQNLSSGTDDDYLTVKFNSSGSVAWRAVY